MEENRCICCGEIIPEGRQVCPSCLVTARHYVLCTKEAFDQCQYNSVCWPGVRVSSNSDCAEYIAAVKALEEKKESENDG